MSNTLHASRRWFTIAAVAAGLGIATAAPVLAQDKYPGKPIRWVVGFPAGGGSDFLARTVANAMSEQMGQPIVIDNRPGAGAMIGADVAARAPADGYTLWTGDMATLVFNPMIYRKVPYKVSDFQPVGLMARFNMVVTTGTATGIDTMAGAVEAMRKEPGKYSYGSVGAGTPHHFVMELFKKSAGVDVVHVPYRGLAPVVQDLIGGQVQFAPIDTASAQVHVKAGKLKALAVTSRARLPAFPQVPTMAELGFKDVEMYAWQGLMVHADTPRTIVDQLAVNLHKALQRPDVRKALVDYGLEITPSSPQELGSYIDQQTKFWGEIVRASGIKLDM
ncbi:MAG: transporter substrate-binding protein [Ramlibacter sp.]|jgi:tripartite-type tricarboxylate transporter receptor subunit TctC|nr:transporter substrate-binding protein [Ramlibacter sp.]